MGWQILKTLLVALLVLLPVTGTAEVAVDMKDGTATLVAEDGKSLDIGQIGKAVRTAGFTPGILRISVVGTVKKDHENLLLDVRNTTLTLQLVKLSPQLKPQLSEMVNSGAVVRLSGTLSEVQSDLPLMTPEKVLEDTP